MSENEYVATAAAEKRLREVLGDRLPHHTEHLVEELALVLLDGAKIEYKARAKQVVISLDVPETATVRKSKDPNDEANQPGVTESEREEDARVEMPTPRITAFVPSQFAEPDYEDQHYD